MSEKSFLLILSSICFLRSSSNNSKLEEKSFSLKTRVSSPEFAKTWNSSDIFPPMAPESALTIL